MNVQDHELPPSRDQWRFIYEDPGEKSLPEYPSGYYLNKHTRETKSFEDGIASIIGKEDESYVYNQWWFEQ
tara:strand:- start:392 stop:604 length:213 start_codon:yes stop_codon:yes gene_type:complete